MLNYCEFIALLQNFISDVNHSLKTLMPNSTSQSSSLMNNRTPTKCTETVRIHQEDYFGNTVLTWAKLNNKIAEKPERLKALGTENSLSPQSYWFTDQPTAVLVIWQATSGKHATTSQSFLFLNKGQLYKDPKCMKEKKRGRGGDPNLCTTCIFSPKNFT